MSTPDHIPNHVELLLDRLPSYFKNAPDFKATLTVFGDRVQDLEDVIYSMIVGRMLDTGQGVQLNQYGTTVGQSRQGRTDEEYRRLIRAKIRLNLSTGRIADILGAADAYIGSVVMYLYLEPNYPAGYNLYVGVESGVDYLSSSERSTLNSITLLATASGVGYNLIESLGVGYFGFDGDPNADGFGDLGDAGLGGNFALLI